MTCEANALCSGECSLSDAVKSKYGCVRDSELVVFMVFDADIKEGDPIPATQFPSKKLARGDLSICRETYTSLEEAKESIVEPATKRGQVLRGVAFTSAAKIREIRACIDGASPPNFARAVCVLDIVDIDDHAGHAALQSCRDEKRLTPKQTGKLRSLIAEDLAAKFGVLQAISDVLR